MPRVAARKPQPKRTRKPAGVAGAAARRRRPAKRRVKPMGTPGWEPVVAIALGLAATVAIAQFIAAARQWTIDAGRDEGAACPQTAVAWAPLVAHR